MGEHKMPFLKAERGLRMGCLGLEPGVRQGLRRARGEKASEAGRKSCASHSFNATSLQMKGSQNKVDNPCHLLLVKKHQEVVCCNTCM